MDQYKVSQTPGSGKKTAPKKRGSKPRSKTPKRKQTRSLNPQFVLGGIVAGLILIFGGVVWARYIGGANKDKPASSAATSAKKGSGSQGAVPSTAFTDVTTAIANKQPGALNKYYAKSVHVVIVKKKINTNVGGKSVEDLIKDFLNGALNPWNWHVPPGDLAAWQQGPYGDHFTGDVIVGISPDGTVISIGFNDDGEIDEVFIAPVGDLSNPPASPTPGGTTGGTGTTDPPQAPGTTPDNVLNTSD